MLVLTRKANEEILIGDNIRIKVVAISGNRVRLGISAPSDTRVMREEMFEMEEATVPFEPPAQIVHEALAELAALPAVS